MGKHFFKATLRDIDLRGRTVLVRVDYNVPLTNDGQISDDLRVRASLPTIEYLLDNKCKVVLMSHLGRPDGRDERYSLKIIAEHLTKLLNRPVSFVDDVIGDKVYQAVRQSSQGSIILLENLRFYAEEEADDLEFAKSIQKAVQADYFVQDGFGVVHRAHASTHAITMSLPSFAGLLLEKEYTTITGVMSQPKRPFVAIMGGAKVSDKIELIHKLIDKADKILVGGAMANTFLAHRGYKLGKSVVEPGEGAEIDKIYQKASEKVGDENVDDFLLLPTDVAVAPSTTGDYPRREVKVENIADEEMSLDIGTETINRFDDVIKSARTVVWNGPMGYAEVENLSIGSARVALAIAQNTDLVSVVGGGDTADFVLKWDGHDGASFTHVSTGGGASMELMAGRKLPGVESLLDAYGSEVVN